MNLEAIRRRSGKLEILSPPSTTHSSIPLLVISYMHIRKLHCTQLVMIPDYNWILSWSPVLNSYKMVITRFSGLT